LSIKGDKMKNNKKIIACTIFALILCLIFILVDKNRENAIKDPDKTVNEDDNEINVGILLSETGTSSIVEKSMINAAKLAFDEINEDGGVNGKKINYIVMDYSSNPELAKKR